MIPLNAMNGESSDNRTGITHWQVRRAAWLIYRMLDFKDRLQKYVVCSINSKLNIFFSQELYPDTTRTGLVFRSRDTGALHL